MTSGREASSGGVPASTGGGLPASGGGGGIPYGGAIVPTSNPSLASAGEVDPVSPSPPPSSTGGSKLPVEAPQAATSEIDPVPSATIAARERRTASGIGTGA
jgi:hypothetical protein